MAIIQRLDGITYDLKELGIRTVDIVISSPSPRHITGEIEGADGLVDYGTNYEPRTINASFRMFAKDMPDFPLLRDEVFHIFRTKESFYFIEKRRPGKRWLVKVNSSFDIEQALIKGSFDIEMIAYSPYAESIGTTQDIQENGILLADDKWGWGMGLIDDDLTYTHTGTEFRIYNAGNVAIHPFEQELSITIDNVQGSTDYLELRNTTNGSTFRVNEGVSSSQTILLDGPNVTSNGLQFLRNTNKQYIELVPGWNDFTVSGATSARVSMDFPFYYL